MFIVTIRNRVLPATSSANSVSKYRHAQKGEPALNNRFHMTQEEANEFKRMERERVTESVDTNAASVTTYQITQD